MTSLLAAAHAVPEVSIGPVGTAGIIASAVILVCQVILQIMANWKANLVAKAAKKDAIIVQKTAEEAARRADEVKGALKEANRDTAIKLNDVLQTAASTAEALTAQLTEIKQTGIDTHVLVNNVHGVALNKYASAMERLAASHLATVEDHVEAKKARTDATEYDMKQAQMDRETKK